MTSRIIGNPTLCGAWKANVQGNCTITPGISDIFRIQVTEFKALGQTLWITKLSGYSLFTYGAIIIFTWSGWGTGGGGGVGGGEREENGPLREKTFLRSCAPKQRLKSTCSSVQSDQSHRCSREETLHPWLPKMRPVKILIRLRVCAGWSESSLGAHFRRYVFQRYGSNDRWMKICLHLFIYR